MIWRVYLLGDIRLTCGEHSITRFESRKVAALVARLALQPRRLHAREELAALLWPDADQRAGLERLRHVLSSLKRQLGALVGASEGEAFLQADRHGVRLRAEQVTCDAFEFAALAERDRFDEAVALYRGELMPGYYDDWIQDERERLSALYENASERASAAAPPATDQPHALGGAVPTAGTKPATRPKANAVPIMPSDASARRVHLPSYLTAFFGRQSEVENLLGLLQTRRLVTITGPGGCGKTRIAVETGRALANAEPNGGENASSAAFGTVAFTPLADCVEPSQIFDRVRAALRLPADLGPNAASPLEQIAITTGDAPALFILDNMEQVNTEGAGEAVETLLARLPHARCLVTSRRPLHVDGEQVMPLSPLPLSLETSGDAEGDPPEREPETASVPASLALFLDRARLVRPDFVLTARNGDDLAAVCRLLEGLPLAIEIAAARIRAYPPAQMRRELEQADDRLTFTARPDVQQRKNPRHGSLQATLSWSWRLLSPQQQNFLADVSFLRGEAWTARLAASVTGTPDAHALLHNLADQSLVQRVSADATNARQNSDGENQDDTVGEQEDRFLLLETVRAFAERALTDARRYELRRRYAAVIALNDEGNSHSGDEAPPLSYENTPVAELLTRGEEALRYAIEDNEIGEAFALCDVLDDLWRSAAGPNALDLVRQTVALLPKENEDSLGVGALGKPPRLPSPLLQARAFHIGSWLAAASTDTSDAEPMARRAEVVAGSDPSALAVAQVARGGVAFARRDPPPEVYPLVNAAVEGARATRQMVLLVEALQLRGQLAAYAEEYDRSELDLREAEQLIDAAFSAPARRRAWANRIAYDRAFTAVEKGDWERAVTLYEQTLRGAQIAGDLRLEPLIRNCLGVSYVYRERWDDGLRELRLAVERGYALGDGFILAFALWNLVRPLAQLGKGRTAVLTLAFAEKTWNDRSGPLTPDEAERAQQWREIARERETGAPWRDGEMEELQARGADLTLAEAVRLVLAA